MPARYGATGPLASALSSSFMNARSSIVWSGLHCTNEDLNAPC
jgi:hypothetical protein